MAGDRHRGGARARRALAAIERGEATEDRCAADGDDWDVEERARATLDRLGLGHLELDRRVGQVSGGEAILLALAAQFLRGIGITRWLRLDGRLTEVDPP